MSDYSGNRDDYDGHRGKRDDDDGESGHRGKRKSRRTRARERAEEFSQREVGNLDAVDEYIAQAEGQIKWEDLEFVLKREGWEADGKWTWPNRDGAELYQSHRYVYKKLRSKKRYLLRHTNADGVIVYGAGPVRVPLGLPEIVKRADEEIELVEGEPGATALRKQGLLATCVQGQNWTDEAAEPFAGRVVNVNMDNDEAGRANTEKAREWLTKIGARAIRVPLLPGLGRPCGLDDWIRDHSVEEYREIVKLTEPSNALPLMIDPTSWEGKPIPERDWIVDQLIPAINVALLYGDGGLGKSILALMLAAARALERDWLGIKTRPGRTLVISAEDDEAEMIRRLFSITRIHGARFSDLGDIRLVDLVGQDAVIGELSRNGRIVATALYDFMVAKIAEFRPQLVIVDALADSFAGDENNRTQARQFVSMLRGAGRSHGCAFLAIAHPSLSGITSGRGTSGSTGWNNSVRSRLYLETFEVEGSEPDPNVKLLRQPKVNYAAGGFEMVLRYSEGVYVPEEGGKASLSKMEKELLHDSVFLSIMTRLASQNRYASDRPSSTYAPTLFAAEKEATEKRITKNNLKAAMVRLLDRGAIRVVDHGPESKKTRRIVEAPL